MSLPAAPKFYSDISAKHDLYVLAKRGYCPGIVYAEGTDLPKINHWVDCFQGLNYKDFKCIQRPANFPKLSPSADRFINGTFELLDLESDFGRRMNEWGIYDWYRYGMGYKHKSNVVKDPKPRKGKRAKKAK
ncbi:hypothetical protein F4804DRAFT_181379 [Jackrogersella minutella]|nr:hypothetical protein F4804DRAFT_181379 [Jackrogersella minutella]